MHLTGNEKDGNRIAVSDSQSSCRIGDSRTRCHAAHTRLPCGSSVAVRHQRCRLFVANEDMLNLRVSIQRIIDGYRMCAGYPEHHIHAVTNETLHEELTAGHA